jgi:hypothetical protein
MCIDFLHSQLIITVDFNHICLKSHTNNGLWLVDGVKSFTLTSILFYFIFVLCRFNRFAFNVVFPWVDTSAPNASSSMTMLASFISHFIPKIFSFSLFVQHNWKATCIFRYQKSNTIAMNVAYAGPNFSRPFNV